MENLQILISQSIKGQESAQRQLYLGHRSKWYMQCLRYGKNKYEADDILQEGLIQIFKDLHQFDETKANFQTWTNRILTHTALRYLKRNSWHNTFLDIDTAAERQTISDSVYDQLAAKELTELIQLLPVGYRVVFNMYVLEGYKHHEIAEQLGITVGTSKSQLSKAKQLLRGKIEFHLIEYPANES